MPDKSLFEYSVIRFMPRVDREEFINIGIILYCQNQKFLRVSFDLNQTRISALAENMTAEELNSHLRSFHEICSGGDKTGTIGKLSMRERFEWLTAPRSTIIQCSPIHTGLSADAALTLQNLLQKLVK